MGRGSFWDRMERIGAEKEAARKEREEKRAAGGGRKAAGSSAAGAAPAGRMKVVWSVRNHMGDPVATFPYPRKAEAEADAEARTEETGNRHYVQSDKVPVDE